MADQSDGRKIYTVGELNREIKVVLEDTYPAIWLTGEISNFKVYSSGHMYFSLKDDEGQISAVIFQGMNRFLKFTPADGQKVLARGKVSSYPKRGDYQIIINYIEPAGKGALQLAFEQLKAKLEKEGLFSAGRKRPIPLLPQRIGIVTSPTGAAIHDILSIINRRFSNIEILLYPVRVQGDDAKYDIVEAIEYLNKNYPGIDVLLVGRGGGSYEDLWTFNEEIVARAIAGSRIPVISCVGHEVDFTIADFVADLRAPTPSAAAELVVRNKAEICEKIDGLQRRLVSTMRSVIGRYEEKVRFLSQSRALRNPLEIFEEKLQAVDDLYARLVQALERKVERMESDARRLTEKLQLLSPLNILCRGYAICRKVPGGIVRSASELAAGDVVSVRLHEGEIRAKVE